MTLAVDLLAYFWLFFSGVMIGVGGHIQYNYLRGTGPTVEDYVIKTNALLDSLERGMRK